MKKKVVIVGGGMSGLVAIKSCLDEGLRPVCFEQHDDIGGIWNYTEYPRSNQGAASYKTLTTNVSKEPMSFSNFPMPEDLSPYLHHTDYMKYLRDYADHFELLQYITFNAEVTKVTKAKDYDETGCWLVRVRIDGMMESSSDYAAVMICTGAAHSGYTPHIPGLRTDFKGKVLHMHSFRTNAEFKDKTVLVVGNQSSAADAATDISNTAKQVYLSLGGGTTLVSRLGNSTLPIDLQFHSLVLRILTKLPNGLKLVAQILKSNANKAIDHTHYGLATSATSLPLRGGSVMVSDELRFKLVSGRVKCKGNLLAFEDGKALFPDGPLEEDIDVVLFATGYNFSLPFVEDEIIQGLTRDRIPWPVYKWVFPLHLTHPTLALIAVTPVGGSVPLLSELQTRWVAGVVSGGLQLPTLDQMTRYQNKRRDEFKQRCQGRFQPLLLDLYESIADELNAVHSVRELLSKGIGLTPIVPTLFRIKGHGAFADGLQLYRESVRRGLSAAGTTTRRSVWPVVLPIIAVILFVVKIALF